MDFFDHWLINVLAGLGIFRLVSDKISNWLEAMSDYVTRKFDLDGNPNTLDYCYLYNPGNGQIDVVGLRFKFNWFNPFKPGKVWVNYVDESGQIYNEVPMSFEMWGQQIKGFIRGEKPKGVQERLKVKM